MSYPKSIEVLVEGDDKTVKAVRLHVSSPYDAAEYEDEKGRKFYISREYMDESISKKLLLKVPLEVITKNEEMRERLAREQANLNRMKTPDELANNKLILPDGFKTTKS